MRAREVARREMVAGCWIVVVEPVRDAKTYDSIASDALAMSAPTQSMSDENLFQEIGVVSEIVCGTPQMAIKKTSPLKMAAM
jgi:hypothetical protein